METPNVTCPYCGKEAEWVENKEIYGRNFGKSIMCYLCRPCNAYVGCHNNGKNPLGTLANKELRTWRMAAHKVVDPFWQSGQVRRWKVYKLMADKFGREIHIGGSDIDTCKAVIEWAKSFQKWLDGKNGTPELPKPTPCTWDEYGKGHAPLMNSGYRPR